MLTFHGLEHKCPNLENAEFLTRRNRQLNSLSRMRGSFVKCLVFQVFQNRKGNISRTNWSDHLRLNHSVTQPGQWPGEGAVYLSAEEKWFKQYGLTHGDLDVREVWSLREDAWRLVGGWNWGKTVRENGFKRGFPAKFIQSWINVILCNEEKPDVRVLYEGQRLCSGWCGFVWVHSYNASLCLDCSASYGPILAHIPGRHPFHHQICSRATGMGWEGVGFCIFLSFLRRT